LGRADKDLNVDVELADAERCGGRVAFLSRGGLRGVVKLSAEICEVVRRNGRDRLDLPVLRLHSGQGDFPPGGVSLGADLSIGGRSEPVSAWAEVVAHAAERTKEALRVLG
jgi:hypothetical protein